MWNVRDESVPWVRRLSAIIGSEGSDEDWQLDALRASGRFGELSRAQFRFWQVLDEAALRGLVRSRSYVAALPEAEREQTLERVSALYHESGGGRLRLPYRTMCFRAAVVNHWEGGSPGRHDGGPVFRFH